MQRHYRNETQSSSPKESRLGLQERGIRVDLVRAKEDLEIAQQVSDDKHPKGGSSERHQVFLSQRRAPQSGDDFHESESVDEQPEPKLGDFSTPF